MNNGLLFIMSLIGLLALYWVLFGQWNYNKMMREADQKIEEKEAPKTKVSDKPKKEVVKKK